MTPPTGTPKRYDQRGCADVLCMCYSEMVEESDGLYVKYSDYAALEAEARRNLAPVGGWQSMDTAPRDGTWIIASFKTLESPWIVQWDANVSAWFDQLSQRFHEVATAWMPLPGSVVPATDGEG